MLGKLEAAAVWVDSVVEAAEVEAEDAEEAIARGVEGRPCASLTRSDLEFIQAVLEERRVDEEEKPAPPSVA